MGARRGAIGGCGEAGRARSGGPSDAWPAAWITCDLVFTGLVPSRSSAAEAGERAGEAVELASDGGTVEPARAGETVESARDGETVEPVGSRSG